MSAQLSSFEQERSNQLQTIRHHTIPSSISHLNWSRTQLEAEQTKKLRRVLTYAKLNSPFYATRLAGIDTETFELKDLSKIKPITKHDVMENWDDIVTDSSLTLAKANKHLETLRDHHSNNYYFGSEQDSTSEHYYLSATGGTSGKRGLYVWDEDLFETTSAITYRLEAAEDMIHPNHTAPINTKRTAVICAESYLHASHMLFPQSPDPQRQVKVFPACMPLNELVSHLNEFQPDRLVSYSSAIAELCNEALSGRLNIQLNRIMSNSEPLSSETRQKALAIWGINIHNSWGSVELGVAGMEGQDFDGIILGEDFHIIEAVDSSGNIIESGEADHMIVTRLFDTTMPLIRYKMTDSPTIEWRLDGSEAPAYRRITQLHGRSDVWFYYNVCQGQDGEEEVKIHPMTFRQVLGQYSEIHEYQVRQTVNGADINLLINDDADLDPITIHQIEEKLSDKLVKLGLQESTANVQVAVVEKLNRHPESNKLTRFVKLAAKDMDSPVKEASLSQDEPVVALPQ